jgi:hypothetical protein
MEKSNEFTGIQTHDLPACNIVPEPTMLQHAPYSQAYCFGFVNIFCNLPNEWFGMSYVNRN